MFLPILPQGFPKTSPKDKWAAEHLHTFFQKEVVSGKGADSNKGVQGGAAGFSGRGMHRQQDSNEGVAACE